MTSSGRVALVTGASQGIGRACALRLAKSGASVAVAARNREKLEEVAGEIAAAGGQAAAFALDVAEEEQIKSIFKSAIGQFGKPAADMLEKIASQMALRLGWNADRKAREITSLDTIYRTANQ